MPALPEVLLVGKVLVRGQKQIKAGTFTHA
jgi:hypothetical protein